MALTKGDAVVREDEMSGDAFCGGPGEGRDDRAPQACTQKAGVAPVAGADNHGQSRQVKLELGGRDAD